MEDGVVENILNYFYGKERKIFVSEVNDATDIKLEGVQILHFRMIFARPEDDITILLCNYIKKCER